MSGAQSPTYRHSRPLTSVYTTRSSLDTFNQLSRTSSAASAQSGTASLFRRSSADSSDFTKALQDTHHSSSLTSHDRSNARWESLWSKGLPQNQGFDKGRCSEVLLTLLSTNALGDLQGHRVLVPGCGRGYDVLEFAKAGAEAVGLEVSFNAVVSARQFARAQADINPEAAARATFMHGDFLTHLPTQLYSYGYDYLFMSYLHPSEYSAWAAAWARLVRPGGMLITLMFPVDPKAEGGPPYPVDPDVYKMLLGDAGFKCIYLRPVPSHLSLPGREDREVLALWQRTVPAPPA